MADKKFCIAAHVHSKLIEFSAALYEPGSIKITHKDDINRSTWYALFIISQQCGCNGYCLSRRDDFRDKVTQEDPIWKFIRSKLKGGIFT